MEQGETAHPPSASKPPVPAVAQAPPPDGEPPSGLSLRRRPQVTIPKRSLREPAILLSKDGSDAEGAGHVPAVESGAAETARSQDGARLRSRSETALQEDASGSRTPFGRERNSWKELAPADVEGIARRVSAEVLKQLGSVVREAVQKDRDGLETRVEQSLNRLEALMRKELRKGDARRQPEPNEPLPRTYSSDGGLSVVAESQSPEWVHHGSLSSVSSSEVDEATVASSSAAVSKTASQSQPLESWSAKQRRKSLSDMSTAQPRTLSSLEEFKAQALAQGLMPGPPVDCPQAVDGPQAAAAATDLPSGYLNKRRSSLPNMKLKGTPHRSAHEAQKPAGGSPFSSHESRGSQSQSRAESSRAESPPSPKRLLSSMYSTWGPKSRNESKEPPSPPPVVGKHRRPSLASISSLEDDQFHKLLQCEGIQRRKRSSKDAHRELRRNLRRQAEERRQLQEQRSAHVRQESPKPSSGKTTPRLHSVFTASPELKSAPAEPKELEHFSSGSGLSQRSSGVRSLGARAEGADGGHGNAIATEALSEGGAELAKNTSFSSSVVVGPSQMHTLSSGATPLVSLPNNVDEGDAARSPPGEPRASQAEAEARELSREQAAETSAEEGEGDGDEPAMVGRRMSNNSLKSAESWLELNISPTADSRYGRRRMSAIRLRNEHALIEGNLRASPSAGRSSTGSFLTGPSESMSMCHVDSLDSLDSEVCALTSRDPSDVASIWAIAWLLKLSGLVPITKRLWGKVYGAVVMMVLVAAIANLGIESLAGTNQRFWYLRKLSTLAVCCGALLGFVGLHFGRISSLLGPSTNTLVMYAHRHDFLEEWGRSSAYQCGGLVVVWVLTVLARISGNIFLEANECESLRSDWLGTLAFVLGSGAFTALSCCLMHVTVMLGMMVDAFCVRFFATPDFAGSVGEWNVLQAILRRAAGVMDNSFLVVQTTALVSLLTLATEITFRMGHLDLGSESCGQDLFNASLVPFPMMVINAYCIFFGAASVSEKCCRVPALVNSIVTDEKIHGDRQYVVQYITSSAAGFYVKDVRLSMAMLLKATYFTGVCVFVVITRVLAP